MNEGAPKKYCPSNGTEGSWFCETFCMNCIHGKYEHTQDLADNPCEILSASFLYDIKDTEYPKQWVYDANNEPTCTSFVKFDWDKDDDGNWIDPPQPEPINPNQLVFPFEIEHIENNTLQPVKEEATA